MGLSYIKHVHFKQLSVISTFREMFSSHPRLFVVNWQTKYRSLWLIKAEMVLNLLVFAKAFQEELSELGPNVLRARRFSGPSVRHEPARG